MSRDGSRSRSDAWQRREPEDCVHGQSSFVHEDATGGRSVLGAQQYVSDQQCLLELDACAQLPSRPFHCRLCSCRSQPPVLTIIQVMASARSPALRGLLLRPTRPIRQIESRTGATMVVCSPRSRSPARPGSSPRRMRSRRGRVLSVAKSPSESIRAIGRRPSIKLLPTASASAREVGYSVVTSPRAR